MTQTDKLGLIIAVTIISVVAITFGKGNNHFTFNANTNIAVNFSSKNDLAANKPKVTTKSQKRQRKQAVSITQAIN